MLNGQQRALIVALWGGQTLTPKNLALRGQNGNFYFGSTNIKTNECVCHASA